LNKEERQAIETVEGNPGQPKIQAFQLEGTYKLRDSVNQLQESIIQTRKSMGSSLDDLTKAIEEQSHSQKSLQKWLVIWTALMALGIIVQVLWVILH